MAVGRVPDNSRASCVLIGRSRVRSGLVELVVGSPTGLPSNHIRLFAPDKIRVLPGRAALVTGFRARPDV